jgi:TDG/mug DNA glycosylase family protein
MTPPSKTLRPARDHAEPHADAQGDLPDLPDLPDLLAPGLEVVFCGINPGRRAAASGHHFDGRGNRFWRVLHRAGFTPTLMTPEQGHLLLAEGCGLTTVVARGTASASEVATHEFAAATDHFTQKMLAYGPRRLAFLGKAGYAGMTGRKQIAWGLQAERFAGAETWILPNPSGLNRAFSLDELVSAYSALHDSGAPSWKARLAANRILKK